MKDTKVTTQVDFYESFLYYTIKQKPIQKFLFLFLWRKKGRETKKAHRDIAFFSKLRYDTNRNNLCGYSSVVEHLVAIEKVARSTRVTRFLFNSLLSTRNSYLIFNFLP